MGRPRQASLKHGGAAFPWLLLFPPLVMIVMAGLRMFYQLEILNSSYSLEYLLRDTHEAFLIALPALILLLTGLLFP